MRDLHLQITGVESARRGLTPLLQFKLRISVSPPTETIQALLLNAQIQVQSPRRAYSAHEKARLFELFGPPETWGQTLRNRLWAHAITTSGEFTGSTEVTLPVQCTYDLNVASTKYFYALDAGEVPLLFLFSGSVFFASPDGRLQVERISWNKECTYAMPARIWRDLMEEHNPNSVWLYLRKDVFDRLCAYKRRHGLPDWEHTIEQLLPADGSTHDHSMSAAEPPASSSQPVELPA